MSYTFTDENEMVGKRPRQVYWKELQLAVRELQTNLENQSSTSNVNLAKYLPASAPISEHPKGITSFAVTEEVGSGYPSLDGVVETIYISEFRNIQHFFEFKPSKVTGGNFYRQWQPADKSWSPWERVLTTKDAESHFNNSSIHVTPLDQNRMTGYSHYQPVVSAEWTITHNLMKYPSVTIVDSGGNVVIGDIQYISQNEVKVNFTNAFSGTAHIN